MEREDDSMNSDRRRRRPSSEVRRLLIEEASRQFTERGYAATTMKDLSTETGISISVLYHHFPSKTELLREAVLTPFMGVVDDLGATWTALQDQPWEDAKLIHVFLSDLYHRLYEHRGALMTLVSAQQELDEDVRAEVSRALRRMFLELRLITEESRARGWNPSDRIDEQIRMMVTFVAGAAVFGEIFLPLAADPNDETLLADMTDFVRFGLSGRASRASHRAAAVAAEENSVQVPPRPS
ncbi:MAG TPA: helix-turn-helix domain-containing protein [Pseudonocardia sp.]|nr:helix-turn-helix domain-containing protein [Pseudonocardia sp.]